MNNTVAIDFTAKKVVANRLEDWAQREPDRVALIEGARQLTYFQWNEKANRLASALIAKGVDQQDIVVVRTQNCLEWPIIYAALAKIGCSVLGLNWRLTADEINYILVNSGARVFICDDKNPEQLISAFDNIEMKLLAAIDCSFNIAKINFISFSSLLESSAAKNFFSQQDPKLIIYTSGTTGFPKGVQSKHFRADEDPNSAKNTEIREYLASVRGQSSGEAETVLVTMPMHHAAGPSIVRTGVSRGSTLVFLPRFDAEAVLRLIEHHKITAWNGVPTMYKRIAALPETVLKKYDVSSIRSLSVGAAPVPSSLKQWIIDFFGNCLRENYGSTEVSMVSALAPEMQALKPGSSGKPFRHVKISVRDQNGRELPTGETGELWIYTPVAISVYLNADPLDENVIDEQGFFRMGDIGRLDEDGYLYITDRSKDMIISGGVNIYPAEIEAALIQHPSVQDVAVIGIPDEEFGEQVKVFCELIPNKNVSLEELNKFAAEKLASYKRPKSIEIVEELPRNTMGKLLKRELRDPYWQQQERKV
ncbi:long-chain fatty acid--CoA ligase [Aurantivibrio infirmus]